jgi:hypothetical protein
VDAGAAGPFQEPHVRSALDACRATSRRLPGVRSGGMLLVFLIVSAVALPNAVLPQEQ